MCRNAGFDQLGGHRQWCKYLVDVEEICQANMSGGPTTAFVILSDVDRA
jgi:hypothetical protein